MLRFRKTGQLLYFLLVLIVVLSTSSCITKETIYSLPIDTKSNSEYKTFTTDDESTVYFSFEYPSYYRLNDQTQGDNNPVLYLRLSGQTNEEFYNGTLKSFDFWITNYHTDWLGFPDAETAMKEHISELKWALIFMRNFRLVEKRRVVVDGVEGWETIITFRERPFIPSGHGTPRDPAFIISRDLFFDYQGMTWQISLYTDKDSYEQQTKEEFEHILSTFKFPK